jgi:GlpG protein
MRRLGLISTEEHAVRFRDYLLTRDIESRLDSDDGEWAVWVLDEDRLDEARGELEQFQASPDAARFRDVVEQANRKRQAKLDAEIAARKRNVNMRRRWEAPIIRRIPVTLLLIVLSGAATAYVRFGDDREAMNLLQIAEIHEGRYIIEPVLKEVTQDYQIWRLVTPIFVHLSVPHLLFNMYALYMLGAPIEIIRGKWRYLLLALAIGVVSNIAQFKHHGPLFGGMSGVVYGFFGYLWWKSAFSPREGFAVPRQMVNMMLFWLVLCMTGFLGNIANTAHVVGLIAGGVLAAAGTRLRRLRSR